MSAAAASLPATIEARAHKFSPANAGHSQALAHKDRSADSLREKMNDQATAAAACAAAKRSSRRRQERSHWHRLAIRVIGDYSQPGNTSSGTPGLKTVRSIPKHETDGRPLRITQ